jgi:cellulose synthase/poly-beta-1,6-N-acetylglucosamine synthase-like glycosyltransferase
VASLCVSIPAHNESNVLPTCLGALLAQKTTESMQVIVVNNGSTDQTSQVAEFWVPQFQSAGHEMLVLRLDRDNKCAALNGGDMAASDARNGVVHGETFMIRLPDSFSDLVRIRTRWISGNRELSRHDRGDRGRRAFPMRKRMKVLLTTPRIWTNLPFYLW